MKNGDSVECDCYLRNFQHLLAAHFSARIMKTSPTWRDNFTRNLSWRGIWKGDILIADIEELENMDASAIYPRRINAKEEQISREGEEFMFPITDGTAKLLGRHYEFRELTQRREQPVRSEDLSGEIHGESGEPPTDRIKS